MKEFKYHTFMWMMYLIIFAYVAFLTYGMIAPFLGDYSIDGRACGDDVCSCPGVWC